MLVSENSDDDFYQTLYSPHEYAEKHKLDKIVLTQALIIFKKEFGGDGLSLKMYAVQMQYFPKVGSQISGNAYLKYIYIYRKHPFALFSSCVCC